MRSGVRIDPLSPNSDQQQFSPNDVYTLSRDKVTRINKMMTKEKVLWSFIIFPQLILKKGMEISLENLNVDIRA